MILKIHSDAQDDARTLRDRDVNGMGKLLALIQQIKADPDLIDSLNIQGSTIDFPDGSQVNSLKFQALKQSGDFWRLKCWNSDNIVIPYRLIYAFFPVGQFRKTPEISILAIVDRSQYNYEPDHHITQRVLRAYSEIL